MRVLSLLLLTLVSLPLLRAFAGESAVAYVYQPLSGLASGEPQLARVYCRDHYSQSGIPAFALISAPNIPPTNSPNSLSDHNIISASGVSIRVTEEKPLTITINATHYRDVRTFGLSKADILRLATEAIARTAKEWKIGRYKLIITPAQ